MLWLSVPISYFVLANTLFRDPASMLTAVGVDIDQVPRYTFFQIFLTTFFYFFYKDYYNRPNENQVDDFLVSLALAGVPV